MLRFKLQENFGRIIVAISYEIELANGVIDRSLK